MGKDCQPTFDIAWCAANGRRIAHASWETYRDWSNDAAMFETTIKYCLA
jgi:hypothetical protein